MPEPRFALGDRVVVTSPTGGRFTGQVIERTWCDVIGAAPAWRYRVLYQMTFSPFAGIGLSNGAVYDEDQLSRAPQVGDPVQLAIPGHVSGVGKVLLVADRLDVYLVFFPTNEAGDVMTVPGEWLQVIHPA
jgi:hypothetical protein